MKRFKAVIFDMDGLLIDSERPALDAFNDTCTQLGLDDLSALFMQCIGTNSAKGQSILREGLEGVADSEQFAAIWSDIYLKEMNQNPAPLKPGAIELLNYVQSIELPMVVATSTNTERALGKLQNLDVLRFFNNVVGGDQVTMSKPSPDIYLRAASKIMAKPTRCLAFEDSSHGVRAAIAAGMTVVQVPDLVQPDADLLGLGHIVMKSLGEASGYNYGIDKGY